mmetsp:Transcript_15626/g.19060  ORF Transcript_15626/g.19060 Transcript_15626/m.19060 type:complete len:341 (-) Transcript_15626:558-1580(-)
MSETEKKRDFPEPLAGLMNSTSVGEIMSGRKPVILDSEMSTVAATSTLAKAGISSAPIKDAKTGLFVGMLDYNDVAHLLIAGLRARRSFDSSRNSFESSSSDDALRTVLESGLSPSMPARLASDLSKMNPLVHISDTASVLELTRLFIDKDLHRVCVLGGENTFIGVVSQSDVLKFLNSREAVIKPLLQPTVKELGLMHRPVVTIPADRHVLEALELMVNLKVSSVAVVDETDGDLLTAITLTDCKKLISRGHKLAEMRMDVREFAARVRTDNAVENDRGSDTFPFFAVHGSTKLEHVIKKLVAVRAHRLFILHGGTKPVGVIAISDILSCLASKKGETA